VLFCTHVLLPEHAKAAYTLFSVPKTILGKRSSVVVKALCYKPEGRGSILDGVIFLNLPIPSGLGPGVYSASNRNEYQKHKNNNVSGE
jgi:hypothetical protein